jgi:hypothetical protein
MIQIPSHCWSLLLPLFLVHTRLDEAILSYPHSVAVFASVDLTGSKGRRIRSKNHGELINTFEWD